MNKNYKKENLRSTFNRLWVEKKQEKSIYNQKLITFFKS